MLSRRIVLLTAVALTATPQAPARAQQPSPSVQRADGFRTRAELAGDLSSLQTILESSHASLDRYTPPERLARQFALARIAVERPMSDLGFYRLLTGILSSIRDGHTRSLAPPTIMTRARGAAPRFPLLLDFIGTHAYVTATTTDLVPLGCDVMSINGQTIDVVRDTILAHLPGDADIVTGKLRALSRGFPVYYYLFIGDPGAFSIRCRRREGGRVIAVRLAALTADEFGKRAHRLPARAELQGPDAAVHLEPLPVAHAARLTLGTFAYESASPSEPSYGALLDSAFARIRRDSVTDLVIDIRANDGGANYGPDVFSRIAYAPFRFVDSVTTRTRDLASLRPFTTLDSSFVRRFARRLESAGPGSFRIFPSDSEVATRSPVPDAYRGCVWMLVDGDTFSAASELASIVRSTHRGVFVGEETGGAYHGNSAGDFVVVTLPATGIRVVVPLERYVLASTDRRDERRGIRPEISVPATLDQIVSGKDSALASVLRAITQRRERARTADAPRCVGI